MKFYCDACSTKYAISDEKVRGKVLKVRCKNCGNIITVREAVAPISREGAAETDPTISTPTHIPTPEQLAVPTTNWYYALNGQTFGPFTLEGLRRKYATAEIGDATYVWHEKLGAWKPVASEPAFADALAIGHKIVPSRKTLGFTGPVEAIRVVHGGPSKERAGAVPDQRHAAKPQPKPQPEPQPQLRPEPQPKPQPKPAEQAKKPAPKRAGSQQPSLPTPQRKQPAVAPSPESPRRPTPAPTPESRPLKDARKSNLDRLRAKLDSSFAPEDESMEPLPRPVGGEAIFTYASGIVPASGESAQNLDARSDDAVDFDLPPAAATRPAKPSPSSTSDILDRIVGPTDEPPAELGEQSEVDDSGVIPFFPEAPKLPSQIKGVSGQEATSESLLIDVGRMDAARKKRGIALAAIAGLVVLVAVGGGITMALQSSSEPAAAVSEPSQQTEHKDELVIPRYDRDEVGSKLATLNLEEELLFDEEDVVAEQTDEGATTKEETSPVAVAAPAVERPKAQETPRQKTRPKPDVQLKTEEPEQPPEEPIEKVDPLAALLAPRANRPTVIKAPEDRLRTEQREGLTKDQARRGFQKVRQSIRDCRERHNRYNAKLDVGKLKISVTVEPTGEVSAFTVNPRSVQNTEFHNCMESHRTRWSFARFTGKPVVINTSVIIQ